ncbi:hypothetical protein EDC04DRAFT_2901882 [Pisolithus marmoratus]|nr:hypothetical protein EDC04DRAFT_2901882 [Pisolithus marmoratus]
MSAPPNLLTYVTSTHNCLVATGLYLGDCTITAKLHWVCKGHGHVLSYMQDLSPTVATLDNGTVVADGDIGSDVSTSPDAAVLPAIVHIGLNNFWLTSDGGYHASPNTMWKEIVNVKLSCTISDPGVEIVSSDFPHILHMLHIFTKNCITPGYSSGKSFFSSGEMGPRCFKLHHQLFESLYGGMLDGDTNGVLFSDLFSFELWSLTIEKNHAKLLALKLTHHILPVPAYNLSGNLIKLSAYQCSLQGTLAEVHFTLCHWPIASLKHDVYSGQIQLIHMLSPPPTSSSSKKRKIPLQLDVDKTPSKKTTSA